MHTPAAVGLAVTTDTSLCAVQVVLRTLLVVVLVSGLLRLAVFF